MARTKTQPRTAHAPVAHGVSSISAPHAYPESRESGIQIQQEPLVSGWASRLSKYNEELAGLHTRLESLNSRLFGPVPQEQAEPSRYTAECAVDLVENQLVHLYAHVLRLTDELQRLESIA